MKRLFDICCSLFGLVVIVPGLVPLCLVIWLQDYKSPFYIPWRVGRGGRKYKMVKLRSMVVRADRTGVDSTGSNDPRITPVGRFVRRYKLDELPQLYNVLNGEMSLVGPRPNVERETDLYTREEKHLLDVRPGITDLSSIVFSDEGEVLKDEADPDLAYNQLIRPYKSRLGLLYVRNSGLWLDLQIIALTLVALVSRDIALKRSARLVRRLGAPEKLCQVARRVDSLVPASPPGASDIVRSRQASA